MLTMLITILIFALIVWLAFWIIGLMGLPEPVGMIARVIVGIIALLVLLQRLNIGANLF